MTMSLPLTPEAQQETIRLIPRDAETLGLFNLLNGNKPLPVAVIFLSVRLEIFSFRLFHRIKSDQTVKPEVKNPPVWRQD